MQKGAIHIHSTYSDGEFTLAELREIFLAENCGFVCMTDHAEYFDERKVAAYRDECAHLSDKKLVFVSGMEYSCEKHMHILGYGATVLAKSADPETVIRHIDDQGGVSVIAHPKDESFEWIEKFATLPQGIETWNSKYDGRYAPRPATFGLLQRLKARQPRIYAFCGQDLHWKKQFRGLFIQLDCDSATPEGILSRLATGEFSGLKGDLVLPSSGLLSDELVLSFSRAHARSSRMWRLLKVSKQSLDRMGVRVPESVKSNLRRIF